MVVPLLFQLADESNSPYFAQNLATDAAAAKVRESARHGSAAAFCCNLVFPARARSGTLCRQKRCL